jgi:hypothetical protein
MTRVTEIVLGLVAAGAVAAGNVMLRPQDAASCVPCLAWWIGAPVVLALGLVLLRRNPAPAAPAREPAEKPERPDAAALRLLATLQEEGRLIDFLQEDIAGYGDEQIGAAVRGIHASCAKALRACVTLEPVLPGNEGESTTVPPGFDPTGIRLVGNVSGTPPFHGVLRHPGWRARSVSLPARAGHDVRVIAPAEVEIE